MLKTFPAFAALLVAAVLVIPTVSQAEDQQSVRVSYADLNLASSPGQTILQRRIAFAAETVCDRADQRDLVYLRAVAHCRSGAIADAQPAVLAAIKEARHPSVTVLETAALVIAPHNS